MLGQRGQYIDSPSPIQAVIAALEAPDGCCAEAEIEALDQIFRSLGAAAVDPRQVENARAVRIEDAIARRDIHLQGRGSEREGPCPICGGADRFSINTEKQVWNCRGCNEGGDIIALVMHLDGLDFSEAVKKLAPPKTKKRLRTIIFPFRKPTGELVYRKKRFEYDDGSKTLIFDPPGRNGSPPLLYGGERLADLGEGRPVWIVEGENKVNRLCDFGAIAVSGDTGHNSIWLPEHAYLLHGLPVILWPDLDEGGEKYIANAAAAILAEDPAAEIRVVRPFGRPNGAKGRDVCDWQGDIDDLAASAEPWKPTLGDEARQPSGNGQDEPQDRGEAPRQWPEPKPLPHGLLPVLPFDAGFLPAAIGPWVLDIADRMQCPADFIGISAVVALGSVLGCKVGVRPKQNDDWTCVPNFWGMIAGSPGTLKSPGMEETLKPVRRMEAIAAEAYADAMKRFKSEVEFQELLKADAKRVAAAKRKAAKDKPFTEFLNRGSYAPHEDPPEEPKAKRFITTDTTYEKLGLMLAENPNGLLVFRDELMPLIQYLDKEEQISARQFYMSAWNGTGGYTFDRMVRGRVHIPHACLSLLGAVTPSGLSAYVQSIHKAGSGGDGLLQRFGLFAWPDAKPDWKNIDVLPDREARDAAWDAFERVDKLTPEDVGAGRDRYHDLPFLRLDSRAQNIFNEWREGLEHQIRSEPMSDALKGHVSKYRSLMPALALLDHLSTGAVKALPEAALRRAIEFIKYLESHARRAYASSTEGETTAAQAILAKIRSGDLQDGFTARDVHQRNWSSLSDRNAVQNGLDLLCDLDWLMMESHKEPKGGRAKIKFRINPRGPPRF